MPHPLRPTPSVLAFAFGAVALAAFAAPALAAAQRTFVASTGDDLNACSITAPCRSFARALAQTNANGEIIVLDSAGYGPVTITKSISIIAPDGVHAGVTVFSGDGIVISGGAIEVVLRGLTINGQGGNRGIFYTLGSRLTVERCVIRNMASFGIGLGFAGNIPIEDSVIRDNEGNGINIAGNPNVVVARTTIEGNVNGIAYASTFGPAAMLAVTQSSILRNSNYGMRASASGPALSLSLTNSTIARNGFEGVSMSSSFGAPVTAAIGSNVIVHNGGGISVVSNGNAGVISGAVSENVVMGNVDFGIQASGVGALVVLDRNTVTHNDEGVRSLIGADVETRANNTVRKNNTNTVGGPFTFVGGV